MTAEPLKVRPDFIYVLLCGKAPRHGVNGNTFPDVFNEIVVEKIPHRASFYIVMGWARGLGTFDMTYQITSQDGNVLFESESAPAVMHPEGTVEKVLPMTATFEQYGAYLVEGFLDGERSFRTTLRIVALSPHQ